METNFPEEANIPSTWPLTLWKRGDSKLLAYAYLTVPAVAEFLVPIELRRLRRGRIGWRADAAVPKIAGGSGSIIDFTLTVGGRLLSATCRRYFEFDAVSVFADGSRFRERFVRPCAVTEPHVRQQPVEPAR